jgi:putative transposase
VRKTFQYRLYPTREQETKLAAALAECRWLYNHFLAARKTAWEERQASLRLYDQLTTLPALKAERPSLATVHSQVLQNVGVRIDLAFRAFFRRVKAGEKPGYPRFRGRERYDSFCYPQAPRGCQLNGDRLTLYGTGTIRVALHRPLPWRGSRRRSASVAPPRANGRSPFLASGSHPPYRRHPSRSALTWVSTDLPRCRQAK